MTMRTHVAMLRGINVGGHNRLPMADLRRVVASLGHQDVETYVQSGNVVFGAADPSRGDADLAAELRAAIARDLGLDVPVVVVSREELHDSVVNNPFPDETNPKLLHAVYSVTEDPADEQAEQAALARARAKGSPDDARRIGPVLYLHTPNGMGRSVLAAELTRGGKNAPSNAGTARNWATVLALDSLMNAG